MGRLLSGPCMYCRATTSLLCAGMIVAVQACMCEDELITESEYEFGSVRSKTGPGKLKKKLCDNTSRYETTTLPLAKHCYQRWP